MGQIVRAYIRVSANALAHRCRASNAWLGTETQSRDSVQPVCSARCSLNLEQIRSVTAHGSLPGTIGGRIMRCDKISCQSQEIRRAVTKHRGLVRCESHRDLGPPRFANCGIEHVLSGLV